MQAIYSGVEDYQAHLVIAGFGKDSSFAVTHKLTYTFKKPNRIRVDFEFPHPGMTIIYPDQDNKAMIRLSKRFPSFALHLDPGSSLLEISPGQHIHQTDLGLLIRNISHSLTDMFLGELDVDEYQNAMNIRVLSDNPFRKGAPTRYVFTIDKRIWLPVAVEEFTPDGILKRRVLYENLTINRGVQDAVFDVW